MKIFDSKINHCWSGKNMSMSGRKLIIRSNSFFEQEIRIPRGDGLSIGFIAKKRTGNGILFLEISNTKSKILLNRVLIKGQSSSEYKISFSNKTSFSYFNIRIYREGGATGTVEIERVFVSSASDENQKLEQIAYDSSVDAPDITGNHPFSADADVGAASIAFIVPYSICGGGEIYIKNIIGFLDRSKLEVSIIFLKNNKLFFLEEDPDVKKVMIHNYKHLLSHLSAHVYDHVVYYNSKKLYEHLIRAKDKDGLPTYLHEIYHSDFYWADSLCNMNHREYLSSLFVISDSLCRDVALPDSANRVLCPVGVNINDFSYKKSIEPIFLSEEFFSSNSRAKDAFFDKKTKSVITVSRLSSEKNIDYILDIAKGSEGLSFFIVGEGGLRAGLKRRIAEEGISNVFLMGFFKNIHAILSAFDAFLLTSSCNEGTPISIIEAMSSGLPVFTTMVGSIEDIISDGDTGLSLLGTDSAADAAKMSEGLSDSALMRKVSEAARDLVERRHNLEVVSSIFSAEILSRHNSNLVTIDSGCESDVIEGYYV
jgi:glycosyltransferase involved in cell wall biosynthesis